MTEINKNLRQAARARTLVPLPFETSIENILRAVTPPVKLPKGFAAASVRLEKAKRRKT